jgi:hypothetical protein
MPVHKSPFGDYYMDGYLQNTLDHFKHGVLKKDKDCFIIMDGREGGGKSTKANQIAVYLDPTFDLSRTVFTPDQFFEAVKNGEKGQCVVFDEAFGYLSSRRALSKFNVSLIKVMAEMRFKNLFIILCLPSFFELDRYAAIHRSKCLIHVFEDKRGNRGRFYYMSYDKKKKLYLMGKKGYDYSKQSANFHGRFTKFFSLDIDDYNEKKRRAVFSIGGNETPQRERDNVIANLLIGKLIYEYGLKGTEVASFLNNMGVEITKQSISYRKSKVKGLFGFQVSNTD